MNGKVCFVSQRAYPGDARLDTEIKSLQDAGYEIHVLCTHRKNQPHYSVEDGIHMHRVPSLRRQRAGKLRYLAEYASFFLPAFALLTGLHLRHRFHLIHVTNLPDALLFAALVPRLMSAKLIFDVRECTPEMFVDRFGAAPGSSIVKLMRHIEQACIRFADVTVTCTEQMRQALIRRGGSPEKIEVLLNISTSVLHGIEPLLPDPHADPHPFRLVTHGTIIKRYGHDVLIQAMTKVAQRAPHIHLDIIGKGQFEAELRQLVEQLGLTEKVTFWGFLPEAELVKYLRAAHVGVVPIVQNPESDLVHTYKMYEYMHLGLPIIISRTRAVESYFGEESLYFVQSGDPDALADAIIDLASRPQKRYELARNALAAYETYSPSRQRAMYLNLVNDLLNVPIGGSPVNVSAGS